MTNSTVGHAASRGEALYTIGLAAAEMPRPRAAFVDMAIGQLLVPKVAEVGSIQHAERTRAVLEHYGFTDEAVSYQLSLMPLAYELTSSDPTARLEAQALAQDIYERIEDESRVPFLEGMGFAVGNSTLANEIGQTVKNQIRSNVDVIYDLVPQALHDGSDTQDGTVTVRGAAISRNEKQRLKDRSLLYAVIDGNIPEGTDPEHLEQLLTSTPLLDIDINVLKDSMDKHDIQSLIARGAESIAILRTIRANKEQIAEIWLLCNNALAYDAPFLDLCGQSAMASELQGLAYEFFYSKDPSIVQKAISQRELSDQYHEPVVELVDGALASTLEQNPEAEYAAQGVVLETRIKSIGSLEKKFSRSKYKDLDLVSDGIAMRLRVPDETFENDLEGFAVNFIQNLDLKVLDADAVIVPWHPTGDPYLDYRNNPKPNGYRSLHLSYVIRIDGTNVPFEIQIVGEAEHQKHTYGLSNHLLYKSAVKNPTEGEVTIQQPLSDAELQSLALFQKRAETAKTSNTLEHYSGLNPYTWVELLKVLPELKTPLTEAFGLSSTGDLVPTEIQSVVIDRPSSMSSEKTFLPASHLDRDQFLFLLSLLDSKLAQSSKIAKALDMVYRTQNGGRQNNYTVAEGHLLPTALHTAIMMTISNSRWEETPSMDIPFDTSLMEIVVVSALLHDTVEDVFVDQRDKGLQYVASEFGYNELLLADRLTLPEGQFPGKNEKQRRYIEAMLKEPLDVGVLALEIKDSDRMSNHMSDVISVLSGDTITDERREFILEYITKTEQSLLDYLDLLPESYRTMHQTVFLLLDRVKYALAA